MTRDLLEVEPRDNLRTALSLSLVSCFFFVCTVIDLIFVFLSYSLQEHLSIPLRWSGSERSTRHLQAHLQSQVEGSDPPQSSRGKYFKKCSIDHIAEMDRELKQQPRFPICYDGRYSKVCETALWWEFPFSAVDSTPWIRWALPGHWTGNLPVRSPQVWL